MSQSGDLSPPTRPFQLGSSFEQAVGLARQAGVATKVNPPNTEPTLLIHKDGQFDDLPAAAWLKTTSFDRAWENVLLNPRIQAVVCHAHAGILETTELLHKIRSSANPRVASMPFFAIRGGNQGSAAGRLEEPDWISLGASTVLLEPATTVALVTIVRENLRHSPARPKPLLPPMITPKALGLDVSAVRPWVVPAVQPVATPINVTASAASLTPSVTPVSNPIVNTFGIPVSRAPLSPLPSATTIVSATIAAAPIAPTIAVSSMVQWLTPKVIKGQALVLLKGQLRLENTRSTRIGMLRSLLRKGDDMLVMESGEFWLIFNCDDELLACRLALRVALHLMRSSDPARNPLSVAVAGYLIQTESAPVPSTDQLSIAQQRCEAALMAHRVPEQIAISIGPWKFALPLPVAQTLLQ
jgi:hypothetical protein